MTNLHPIAFRLKTQEPKPHPMAQHWTKEEIEQLFDLPFLDLIFQAATVHRQNFDARKIQLSTLISIKTGGCSEKCEYCSQSAHYNTNVEKSEMLAFDDVLAKAKEAKSNGATRFCMGAAWRGLQSDNMDTVLSMIRAVKAEGLETCGTFGLLEDGMAEQLKEAGLDYYNHNLDTDPEYYNQVIHTRFYEDRLDTLGKVRAAGLKICCGGIIGMNETRQNRAGLIASLANLSPQPESVPINQLVRVAGTPMENAAELDWTEFIRTIAVARIAMPKSFVRLSAGRSEMSEAEQAMCFLAGANSIFYGDKLLTTDNVDEHHDMILLKKLGLMFDNPK